MCTQFLVAGTSYNTYVTPEEVIAGNDGILKCSVPSFVSDFVGITAWVDSEGLQYFAASSAAHHGKFAALRM